jgi:hypothetical protein
MDDLELERQEAIRALSRGLSAERITVDQFESRLVLVRQAPNRATLDAIIADLIPTGEYDPPVPMAMTPYGEPVDTGAITPAEVIRISTVLGSSKRAGSWTVPYRLELKVVLGDLTIDLREAVFFSDTLEIDMDILLGGLTLIVPAGTQVENETNERWSSTSHSTRSTQGMRTVGLLVRITGKVRWSNIEIKEKRRPGEPSPIQKLLGA